MNILVFRYNISFIDPPLGVFGEIFPEVMIFPFISFLQEIFRRISLAPGLKMIIILCWQEEIFFPLLKEIDSGRKGALKLKRKQLPDTTCCKNGRLAAENKRRKGFMSMINH